MKKNSLIGFMLIGFLSASTAFGTWFAMNSEFIYLLISSTTAWFAYSEAHRQFTGELVHKSGEELKIRGANTLKRKIGLFLGLILCVAAFPICILGVHETSLAGLAAGYFTFFSGYIIAHYNWFGSFL